MKTWRLASGGDGWAESSDDVDMGSLWRPATRPERVWRFLTKPTLSWLAFIAIQLIVAFIRESMSW